MTISPERLAVLREATENVGHHYSFDGLPAVAIRVEDLADLITEIEQQRAELEKWQEAVDHVYEVYPTDIFLPDSPSIDAQSARVARLTADNIKRWVQEALLESEAENE